MRAWYALHVTACSVACLYGCAPLCLLPRRLDSLLNRLSQTNNYVKHVGIALESERDSLGQIDVL